MILGVPYLAYLVIFTAAVVSGYSHPQLVHRSSFYCTIDIPAVAHLGTGIVATGLLFSLVVGILTFITLYRHWQAILKADTKGGLDLSLVSAHWYSRLGVSSPY